MEVLTKDQPKTLTLRESTAAYIMGIQPLKVALKQEQNNNRDNLKKTSEHHLLVTKKSIIHNK